MTIPAKAALIAALCAAAFPALGAQAPSAAGDGKGEAAARAMAAMEAADPELANHFGVFSTRPLAAEGYGRVVAAANIATTLSGKRWTPASLDELAAREKLFSENAYGAAVVLDAKGLCRLLELATGGKYAVSLEARVEGRVPDEEAQEAESSPDLFVVLAYIDRVPMIERRFAWGPDGRLLGLSVANPLAGPAYPPYLTKSDYDPAAIDAWEFYRFRKGLR